VATGEAKKRISVFCWRVVCLLVCNILSLSYLIDPQNCLLCLMCYSVNRQTALRILSCNLINSLFKVLKSYKVCVKYAVWQTYS